MSNIVVNRENWNMKKETNAAGRPDIRSSIQDSKPKVIGAYLTTEVMEIKRIKCFIKQKLITK